MIIINNVILIKKQEEAILMEIQDLTGMKQMRKTSLMKWQKGMILMEMLHMKIKMIMEIINVM